jgi:putative FmdB family regulatory protein
MPLFEFTCKKCNKKFEALVFDKENIECPECKSDKIVKEFSNFTTSSSSQKCINEWLCPTTAKHRHKYCDGCRSAIVKK